MAILRSLGATWLAFHRHDCSLCARLGDENGAAPDIARFDADRLSAPRRRFLGGDDAVYLTRQARRAGLRELRIGKEGVAGAHKLPPVKS